MALDRTLFVSVLGDRRGFTRVLIAAGIVSLVALVFTVVITGVSDQQVLPGIPMTEPLITRSLPLVQWLRDLSAVLAVGFVLVGGLLVATRNHSLIRLSMLWCGVFLASAVLLGWMSLADIYALTPRDALNVTGIQLFIVDTIPGRVVLYQVFALVAAMAILAVVQTRRGSAFAFALILTAAAAPAFNGHAGLGGGHESATASLALHIAALSVWVGGLVATAVLVSARGPDLVQVVLRFSTIALWCVIITAETGLINASMRLTTWQAVFDTTYGQLIVMKSVLLLVLVYMGWRIRRKVLPDLTPDNRGPFLVVAAVDVVIMGVALALAVVLARTDPNAVAETAVLPLSYFWIAVIATSAAAFFWVTWRSQDGSSWSRWRTVPFVLGLVAVAAGSAEFSGEYSQVGFAVHVLQTTLLTFVAPLLIILGVPEIARTSWGRALQAYPEAIAIGLIFVFYTVIFGPLYDLMMVSHEGHLLMQLILLAAGFFFVISAFQHSAIAIVIPMVVWPLILVAYPTTQALANVVVTEAVLVVMLVATIRSARTGVSLEREPSTISA